MSDLKLLGSNIGYTTLLRIVSSGVPFVLYAYLFRTLGSDSMGTVVLMLSIAAILRVLVSFGFEVSGVKSLAQANTTQKFRLKYLSTATLIQLSTWGVILVASEILFQSLCPELLNESRTVSLMLLGELFWFKWYFQAKLKMEITFRLTLFSELSIFITTLLIIKTSTQHQDYLLIRALITCIAGLAAFKIVHYFEGGVIVKVPLKHAYIVAKSSFSTFSSRIVAVLHDELSTLVLASWLSVSQLANFDLARKVINLFCLPNSIINTVAFSHLTKSKDLRFAKRIFWLRNTISMVFTIIMIFMAPVILTYFSLENSETELVTNYLILMSPLVFVRGVMYFTGTSLLVSFGYEHYFNRSVYLTFGVYITFIGATWLSGLHSVNSVILIILISESFEAIYRYIKCKKVKVL